MGILSLVNAAITFEIDCPLDGGQKMTIRVEHANWNYWRDYRPTQLLNLRTAHEILKNPLRIYSGYRRPVSTDKETLCFVGKPANWYISPTDRVPFPKNRFVYLAFLNTRKSLIEFGAEKSDFKDEFSPIGFGDRFEEIEWNEAWKKTSLKK